MNNLGIYIHIPFCKQKCRYCDFVSFPCIESEMEDYFGCLQQEIGKKADEINSFNQYIIDTIYIGGGTPSIVPAEYIERIIKKIHEKFNVSENAEITIEVNPGTVDEIKIKKYLSFGINRLSIGLQSTNNKLLEMLGRIHNYNQFEEVYELVRKVGFRNINIDLMIGLPNQSLADVEDSLNKIIKKAPEHISVYSLIVEDDTPISKLIGQGVLELPSEELERNMYWKVKKVLEENGYKHYEISNFAKPSFESKHNMNCWNQHYYLGFGISAHSYFNDVRYSNIADLKEYINNIKNNNIDDNVVINEKQDKIQMMNEYMLLGLRKIDGVSIRDFKNKFVDNPIYVFRKELDKLVKQGLVEVSGEVIKLTDYGIDLANQVWMEFV